MRRHQRQNHLLSAPSAAQRSQHHRDCRHSGFQRGSDCSAQHPLSDSIYRLTKRPANSSEWRCFPNRDRRHYGIVTAGRKNGTKPPAFTKPAASVRRPSRISSRNCLTRDTTSKCRAGLQRLDVDPSRSIRKPGPEPATESHVDPRSLRLLGHPAISAPLQEGSRPPRPGNG